jgi:hypothetical protein
MFRYLINLLLIILVSCEYPKILIDKEVYFNDFESNSLENISGGAIYNFNSLNVLGNFNNDGFRINISEIEEHDYVFLSFDLYIHGSWDGNVNGKSESNQVPDKWIIEFNPDMPLHSDKTSNRFVTTFSNSVCYSNYCKRQSYPNSYPFDNLPKTGMFLTDLPETCPGDFFGGPTTLYKFEKGFSSSGKSIIIRFYDELYQPNAIGKGGINKAKCDESWSIDNLSVRIVKYD